MTRFFLPATRLMGRLRIGPKFLVAGAPALLLLLILGIGLLVQLNQRVRALESKRVAAELMADLIEWNKALIESRRVSIAGGEGRAGGPAFKAQSDEVGRKLADVERKAAAAAPWFDMTRETTGLRDGWVRLQQTLSALPPDAEFAQKAFAAHAPEYTRLYAYMRDLGNKSGLSQDPDTDLSYLGYTLANNSPMTAGITVRIATYAALNLYRAEVSVKDKLFYEVTAARLDDTFGAVETLLSQSMRANPEVEAALGRRFAVLKDDSKLLLGFVRKNFIDVDKVSVSQASLTGAAEATIRAAWDLVEGNRSVLGDLLRLRGERAALQRNGLAALMLLGVLSSAYLYVGIYLSVAASLRQATTAARAIAGGKLGTVEAGTSRDEFADLIADMARADQSLARIFAGVKLASESIATASREIADGTHDLSHRTERASSTLQGTASSMVALTDTVAQGTQAASTAAALASSAAAVAVRGGDTVSQVVATMGAINASSRKIGDIIGVIDGIAFQTNILALNAAVEAARAGDQGRGFAVVASEVRSLAKRSADAAREIKSLINASVGDVEAGARMVTDAGSTMTDIVASVQRVHEVISSVTLAAGRQGDGIAQVNGAVLQLDEMTQQNASLVEQNAAAADSLKQQAGRLAGMVAGFEIQKRG